MPAKKDVVRALLDRYPRSYGEEVGADPASGRPSDLFRLLTAALLFSARISADIAVSAAKALADEGWTTAEKMAASTWAQRAKTLNEAGYARYDERTSAMLGDTAELLLDRYGGDLRRLREEAGRDPAAERRLLKECKGLGDVGVDIFFREVQAAWDELAPFVDDKALSAARRLDLAGDAGALARLVDPAELPRLLGALVRTDLDDADDEIRAAAGGSGDGGRDGDGDSGDGEPTKAELYERAQQLDIAGRSSMDKAQLQEAVSRQG